ncbi:serine hydrolase domain-containing protein [Paenibacillus sp. NPDC056579]|uniref:serine hydrolase domain-containing protein n=1 Tax=Paenibacillus sp. NPDC056579 TaxID=3345871 RepID=UPI003695322D
MKRWEAKLEAHFDTYAQEQQYSGTILVAQHGEVLFHKAYGMASYEHDVPNRPDTRFHIASITKPVTALAVLMLADRQRIDVDRPIGDYIELGPQLNRNITIHHLLIHTSGIPDFEKLPDYAYGTERTLYKDAHILELIQDVPSSFEPGEGWSYCNTGYNLLGLLIEHAAEMSYEQFVGRSILEPLGMSGTGFGASDRVVRGLASGYSQDGNGMLVKARYHELENFKASGNMVSTAADLLKLDQALYSGRSLLSEPLLSRMFTPHAFIEQGRHYGYGLSIYGDGSRGHGGWLPGYWCKFRQFPASGRVIVMLSNHDFTKEDSIVDRTEQLLLAE